MTFKKWEDYDAEDWSRQGYSRYEAMLADWKTEREQVEIALLATRQQRDDEFNCAEKLKAEREKLIGALEEIKSQPQECQRIMEKHDWKYDDSEDFNQKMIFTMYSHVVECAVKAEAVLAEVKGGKE